MAVQIGNARVNYFYNALGQRVLKTGPDALVPGGVVRYVYDQDNHLLGEYDAAGKAIQETVWMGDTPVAMVKPGADGRREMFYIHADHLDTPRAIVRPADNAVVWRWEDREPFGLTPPDENPGGLGVFIFNLRFPGQVFDRETGLIYNLNRYYDSAVGRYTQSDPIGLVGGINTYAYVGANPLSNLDAQGLMGFGSSGVGSGAGRNASTGGNGSPCKCPTPPIAPPGACVADNIDIAKDYPAWNPGSMVGLFENVRNYGTWDYKRRGRQYEDFGNFNFGAVTAAMGVPGYVAQNGAGIYQQMYGAAAAGTGTPLLKWPYGDDPKDAAEIERGRQYAKCKCR